MKAEPVELIQESYETEALNMPKKNVLQVEESKADPEAWDQMQKEVINVRNSEKGRQLDLQLRQTKTGVLLTASGEKVKRGHNVRFSQSPAVHQKQGVDGS